MSLAFRDKRPGRLRRNSSPVMHEGSMIMAFRIRSLSWCNDTAADTLSPAAIWMLPVSVRQSVPQAMDAPGSGTRSEIPWDSESWTVEPRARREAPSRVIPHRRLPTPTMLWGSKDGAPESRARGEEPGPALEPWNCRNAYEASAVKVADVRAHHHNPDAESGDKGWPVVAIGIVVAIGVRIVPRRWRRDREHNVYSSYNQLIPRSRDGCHGVATDVLLKRAKADGGGIDEHCCIGGDWQGVDAAICPPQD